MGKKKTTKHNNFWLISHEGRGAFWLGYLASAIQH